MIVDDDPREPGSDDTQPQEGPEVPEGGSEPAPSKAVTAPSPRAGAGDDAPWKVCAHCSVESQTGGDFCPNCGKPYVHKTLSERFSKRTKIIVAVVAGVLLLGGAGTAVGLKIKHDNDVEAQQKQEARERAAAEERAQEQAAAEQEAAAQQAAADEEERKTRRAAVKELQKSITKDAKDKVNQGLLDGPILRTTCQAVGGGNADNLSETTTKYECLAVQEDRSDGTSYGYSFTATMNWDDFSYTWQLGN